MMMMMMMGKIVVKFGLSRFGRGKSLGEKKT